MGDIGDYWRDIKEARKEESEDNLECFLDYLKIPDRELIWFCHNEYHYSIIVRGSKLDYWPSKKKFMYKGKVKTGNVLKFIESLENDR